MLLHIVDIAPFDPDADPVRDARAIVGELKRYDVALHEKPRWLVLNKLDLVPEGERKARVGAFVKAYKWKGPVFAIAAVNGEGCRELVFAIQDWLDAHPPATPAGAEPAAETASAERGESIVGPASAGRDDPPEGGPTGHSVDEHARRQRAPARRQGGLEPRHRRRARARPRGGCPLGRADRRAEARRQGNRPGLVGRDRRGHQAARVERASFRNPRAAGRGGGRIQMGLVQAYESAFKKFALHTAQILLTHDDLADRRRYLNSRSTLLTLLALGVIPIINENDTVTTDEIRFGDNDTLGALVTNLIEADVLVLLTDQHGLYSADPRRDPAATLVQTARAGDPQLEAMAGGAGRRAGPRRNAVEGAGGEARVPLRRIDDHR